MSNLETEQNTSLKNVCSVVVHAPLGRKQFHYLCPNDLTVRPGDAVAVPFGSRELIGWIIRVDVPESETSTGQTLKSIIARVDGAGVGPSELALAESLHSRDGTNFSDILGLFVPPAPPKLVQMLELVSPGSPLPETPNPTAKHIAEQLERCAGRMEIRKAEAATGCSRPAFKIALKELVRAGIAAVKTEIVIVRPGKKKFLGPIDPGPSPEQADGLNDQERKIIRVAAQHPFQYNMNELARLAQSQPKDVRALVSRRLLTESVLRRWRTPMEREASHAKDSPEKKISAVTPTTSQQRALDLILPRVENMAAEKFLLYGPTAAGKTHVYESAARAALARGKQVLLMVPEIALTKPLIDRIRETIAEPFAVIHSRQTPAERRDEWQRCASGEARLLVGPRSAAFVPLPDFGLAIVDECHDAGYKQSDSPYIDSRAAVEEKCRMFSAPMIIGSATPTVEQIYLAAQGVWTRVDLTDFPTRRSRPAVTVLNLRQSPAARGALNPIDALCRQAFLTPELQAGLEETLNRKESAVLLLNRRGFAPLVSCPSCGMSIRCEACLIGMTYHAQDRRLLCHGCGQEKHAPDICPTCGHSPLGYMGVGTERIEEACRRRFPKARIGRLDQDSFRKSRKEAFGILEALAKGQIDILIGTQMIAKGLDVPSVTLSAVVFADVGLSMPDYRSGERTFQLLAQLIGRSGRHEQPGRALIQTFQPGHPAIDCSRAEDVARFYDLEIETRKLALWPPFVRLVRILVQSENAPRAIQQASGIRNFIEEKMQGEPSLIYLSPVVSAPRPKWNNEYRFQMLMKLTPGASMPAVLAEGIQREYRRSDVKISIEPDPVSVL